jgi:hypothetical protein
MADSLSAIPLLAVLGGLLPAPPRCDYANAMFATPHSQRCDLTFVAWRLGIGPRKKTFLTAVRVTGISAGAAAFAAGSDVCLRAATLQR